MSIFSDTALVTLTAVGGSLVTGGVGMILSATAEIVGIIRVPYTSSSDIFMLYVIAVLAIGLGLLILHFVWDDRIEEFEDKMEEKTVKEVKYDLLDDFRRLDEFEKRLALLEKEKP